MPRASVPAAVARTHRARRARPVVRRDAPTAAVRCAARLRAVPRQAGWVRKSRAQARHRSHRQQQSRRTLMKATELLMKQHRLVEDLFEQFEEAGDATEKRELFAKLAQNLVAHDAIEREIFYPACEKELGSEDEVLGESLVEHGLVEFCLFRADQRQTAEDF